MSIQLPYCHIIMATMIPIDEGLPISWMSIQLPYCLIIMTTMIPIDEGLPISWMVCFPWPLLVKSWSTHCVLLYCCWWIISLLIGQFHGLLLMKDYQCSWLTGIFFWPLLVVDYQSTDWFLGSLFEEGLAIYWLICFLAPIDK